jgi:hypothetical protein
VWYLAARWGPGYTSSTSSSTSAVILMPVQRAACVRPHRCQRPATSRDIAHALDLQCGHVGIAIDAAERAQRLDMAAAFARAAFMAMGASGPSRHTPPLPAHSP